jgi:hypothetical protein
MPLPCWLAYSWRINFFPSGEKVSLSALHQPSTHSKNTFTMENDNSSWKDLVVQIFQSKSYNFLYVVKAGDGFLPSIKKAVVSKQIPEAGIYKIRCKQYTDDKGYKSLYIHTATALKEA